MAEKQRLDVLLVERGLIDSRELAAVWSWPGK
jgi:predicted rRNA methylase YqxC with S4 and FtsJ domains